MLDNTNELKNKKEMNRRKFFSIIGNSATGVVVLGSLGITIDFLAPNVLKERPRKFEVGPIQNILPDTVIYEPEYKVFVIRDENGAFYAISSVCTHLGCTVKWMGNIKSGDSSEAIACPCHGSKFNRKGEVIEGPAPNSLQRYRVRLSENKLIVDTSEIVSEEEMYLKV